MALQRQAEFKRNRHTHATDANQFNHRFTKAATGLGMAHDWLPAFLESEALPARYAQLVTKHFAPIAAQLASAHRGPIRVIGVNGAQGTGKSTLASVLQKLLQHEHGLTAAILSIDDLYLTRDERLHLAAEIHPLLATRGVPGTHDVALGLEVIEQLKSGGATRLPRFNKAVDDRMREDQWSEVEQPIDLLLFEGWCMAACAEPDHRLPQPINELEERDDADGRWRQFVNRQLRGPYTALFGHIDQLIMLKAPDFECVCAWRAEQEGKLRVRMQAEGKPADAVMDAAALARFMMHYERLTRWMLEEMPARADLMLELTADHGIRSA